MHRAPPEKNRNARLAPGVGVIGLEGRADNLQLSHFTDADKVVFTAVPRGLAWQVKALAPNGDVSRHGRFDGRLAALGAACLMAAHSGGQVTP